MPKDFLFVSCDIVAHSAEASIDVQIERVTGLHAVVSQFLKGKSGIIWLSGGDGGHLAFPLEGEVDQVESYIIALRKWSAVSRVSLRISCNDGTVEAIQGPGGQLELIGHGVNLAGRLIRLGSATTVLATDNFRNKIAIVPSTRLRFHDARLLEPKTFDRQDVWLVSVDGEFTSKWAETNTFSDRTALSKARERGEALDIIYHAKRLLEVNPSDSDAIKSLQEMALKKLRIAEADSFITDVFLDPIFGPDVICAGTLVERGPGETVVDYNDEGQTMFYILKGAIEVCLPTGASDQRQAGAANTIILTPGELTGELAFALRRKRTATLRCLEKSALLCLNYTKILKTCEEQNLRDQLKGVLDRKICERIVEYVWTTTPYFQAAASTNPQSRQYGTWLPLLASCSLTTLDWNKGRKISHNDKLLTQKGICILLSGKLEMVGPRTILDGVDCPLVFVALSDIVGNFGDEYRLLEKEVKLMIIQEEALLQLDPEIYEKALEGIAAIDTVQKPSRDLIPAKAMPTQKKHVFLSYCKDDQVEVSRLHDDLVASGEAVWWMMDIKGGQDWKTEIRKAMRSAYAVVIFFSQQTASRMTSGIYPEVFDAVNAYREYAPGEIFIIPVRLSECEIPPVELDGTRTLDRLQWIDLFPENGRSAGFDKLLEAIRATPHHPLSKGGAAI